MKIAVVTGASRGLGKSMALHLASRGVGIIGTYNSKRDEADAVASEIQSRGSYARMLQLDVGSSESLAAFAKALPAVLADGFSRSDFDYLVNNAGVGLHAPILETSEAELDELFAIHVKAPFLLTQKLIPMMLQGGTVLNVSSGLARFTIPGIGAYAMMKGAIEVLTRYMAKEFGERKITVNVIAPGAIATDFSGGIVRDNPEMSKMIASSIPLGRVGLPDDVGAAVAALLSDDCKWINGTRIESSGGQNL
jgi:NAD(P)-dependent dehydrogenase (short-subunit alcohol dehydrogenase family)